MAGGVAVAGLSRRLGGARVLDRLTFAIEPGEAALVTGPNGSGKTTLLRILAGLLAPDGGTVEVGGLPPGRGGAAFVPAGDRGLHWRLTGLDNLEFFARLAGAPPAAGAASHRTAAVHAALEAFNASRFARKPVGVCSTGERRRLLFARAILSGAPVLLADEPWSDLDEPGRDAVAAVSRAWTEAGGCVVFAAPSPGDAPRASRSIALEAAP